MTNVIVAFSKIEDAKSIKNILMRSGFEVIAVCTSGAQVLSSADSLNGGIVVSGYRFEDMLYEELHECLPEYFEMLLVASPDRCNGQGRERLICLSLPLKVHDLVSTMQMLVQGQIRKKRKLKQQPKERSGVQREIIEQAKSVLMERNNMTEQEAHRYIQKCSMDGGTNMVETSKMVLSLLNM